MSSLVLQLPIDVFSYVISFLSLEQTFITSRVCRSLNDRIKQALRNQTKISISKCTNEQLSKVLSLTSNLQILDLTCANTSDAGIPTTPKL